jgi:membrane protein
LLSELVRVELVDRSLALGAQALLTLIPLFMVLGAFLPSAWGRELLAQIRAAAGMRDDVMEPLRQAAVQDAGLTRTESGVVGLLVTAFSASSFALALKRRYERVWELPGPRGVRALRGGLLWLAGWVAVLQITALLLRSLDGGLGAEPVRLAVQLLTNALVWWWAPHVLLAGRVSWRLLLPGALLTSVLLAGLSRLSAMLMPRSALSNLEQFGPVGVVFSLATWLVAFGGALVLGATLGHLVAMRRHGSVHVTR